MSCCILGYEGGPDVAAAPCGTIEPVDNSSRSAKAEIFVSLLIIVVGLAVLLTALIREKDVVTYVVTLAAALFLVGLGLYALRHSLEDQKRSNQRQLAEELADAADLRKRLRQFLDDQSARPEA